MNKQQQHLLKLLKEIDYICEKNSIEYFTAGGTVIGAVRHEGFIPWDDDVDIYMTKDNFQKFREAFKKENLQDRKLEFKDDNPGFFATIARYNEETTTQICRYHVLGNASGGLLIDILIMDDFPNDAAKRKEYLAKLNIYADLISVPYTHSQRNDDDFLGLYDQYREKIEKKGREEVIKELEADLFQYDKKECDDYILRWGALPIIIPKKIMGRPVRLKFEDMYVPVPQDWYDYLVLLYGPDWVNIPHTDKQETHIAVSSIDYPYEFFMRERDRFISQTEAASIYWKRKEYSVRLQYSRRPIENYILDFKVRLFLQKYGKIFDKDYIKKLYNEGKYEDVVRQLSKYIKYQTEPLLIGELKHAAWHRWQNPIIIPVDEDILNMALTSLILTGSEKKSDKIMRAYRRAGKDNLIKPETRLLYDKTIETEKLYYYGDYNACLENIERSVELAKSVQGLKYFWLSKAAKCDSADRSAVIKELRALMQKSDCFVEIKKALADALYDDGAVDEAKELYSFVLENSRNGIFWLDILKKTGQKGVTEEKKDYIMTEIEEKEKVLIETISQICEDNNIRYVLSDKLVKNIELTGGFGYRGDTKKIYMDVLNARKFIDAFGKAELENCELFSWKNNSNLRDFKIVFSDKSSAYARLDRLKDWIGIGLHVDIIILRAKSSHNIASKLLAIREAMLNVANLNPVDKALINSPVRKFLYGINKIVVNIIGKQRFSNSLFNSIMKHEDGSKATGKELFFRENLSGGLYKNKKIPNNFLTEITDVEVYGKKYFISANLNTADENEINPPKESLFSLMEDGLTWKEVLSCISLPDFTSMRWEEYGKDRKKLNDINKKVKKMWLIMGRGEDKLSIRNQYIGKVARMKELISNNDIDELGRTLSVYAERYNFYKMKKMTFFVFPELTEIYCEYLRLIGSHDEAKEIEKMSSDEKYLMDSDLSNKGY